MIGMGTVIRSKRTDKIVGSVVGFGTIMWPQDDPNLTGDDAPWPVYLVKVSRGSSGLGPACATLRADMVEEVI